MYALFKNGKQLSKAHSVKRVAWVEAMERKVVFGDKWKGYFLLNGYSIERVDL